MMVAEFWDSAARVHWNDVADREIQDDDEQTRLTCRDALPGGGFTTRR